MRRSKWRNCRLPLYFDRSGAFKRDQGFEVAQGLIDVNLNGISSSSISNLKPCYTYELRIAAGTNAGYGEYESVIVSTETTAPSSVKDLRASTSSNVIEISWDFETTTANPCRATTFFVDYQVLDIECNSNIPVPDRVEYTETSEMLATINDILPEAIYQIWVTAGNSAGEGPEMTIIVNSNAAAPIAAPQNVVYLESAESQVTFSWDVVPCELTRGIFVSYGYELIDQTDNSLDRNGNVRETSVTLTLDPNIAYFFRVAVANDYGLGPFSADISVPTVVSDSTGTLTIALTVGGTGIIMLVVMALACSCVIYRRRLSIKRTVSKPTGYPGEPTGYPGEPTGYPGEPTGYPGEPTGYPGEPTGYPGEPTGYPGEPTGYPGEPTGYPGEPTGYPGEPTGYPGEPTGYPGEPTGYPGEPTGYPGEPTGYPGEPTGYPGEPTGYPERTNRLSWRTNRLSWRTNRLSWRTNRLSWRTNRISWRTNRLSWRTNRISWRTNRLSWRTNRLSWRTNRLSWRTNRLSWRTNRLSWRTNRLSWRTNRLS
ncbi:uncharacterized protein [Amphiura filiformis]|uniref:uncharacterized protein n=1 Tax=Amphiura filiformis TaxID=82378 RepID=UPI003B20F1CC